MKHTHLVNLHGIMNAPPRIVMDLAGEGVLGDLIYNDQVPFNFCLLNTSIAVFYYIILWLSLFWSFILSFVEVNEVTPVFSVGSFMFCSTSKILSFSRAFYPDWTLHFLLLSRPP